jgi:hypothetical protein
MHVPALLVLLHTGEISPELAGDPDGWLRRREAFISRMATEHADLHPVLPVVYHLDRDFVTAARTRHSINVVDDCNGRELCGVATNELTNAWALADVRAMFTSPSDPPDKRNAEAVAILGTFEGEPLDEWVADIKRAGIANSKDPRVVIPLLAAQLSVPFPRAPREEGGPFGSAQGKLRPGERPAIHGATLSVVNRLESHLIATASRIEINRLHHLGYDTITLVPFAGQRGFSATEIHRYDTHPAGETDLAMSLGAARAHAVSMRVMLKPHIWAEREHGGDPTQIEPRDWAAWFASYEQLAIHEALLARAIGAEWLCLGTELSRAESRPEWRRVIATVRAIYHGRITYAANFDAFERTPFWDALDAIGIDAYFPLSSDRNTSDRALRDGARDVVARIDVAGARWNKPVILTELGYPSTAAPWIEPWREDRSAGPAPRDQARAFAAMLDAIRRSKSISGFIIWKYESDPDRRDERGYLPKAKPAEKIIAKALRDEQ